MSELFLYCLRVLQILGKSTSKSRWLACETVEDSNPPLDDIKAIFIHEHVKAESTESTISNSSAEILDEEDDSAQTVDQLELKEGSQVPSDDDLYLSEDLHSPPIETHKVTQEQRQQIDKSLSNDQSDSANLNDDLKLLRKLRRPKDPEMQAQKDKEDQLITEFYCMKCNICKYSAADYKVLYQHFKLRHNLRCYIMCCKKKLTNRKMLLHHIAYHEDPTLFRCDQCNKCYKSLDYLDLHKSNIHGSQNSDHRFKCEECGKTFTKKFQLKNHQDIHKRFECQICKRILSSRNTLYGHMKNVHNERNRSMFCDFCGQEFRDKICFERHLNEHKGIEPPKLQCQFCQNWYRGERNLQHHVHYSHNQKGHQYPCDICQQTYPNERAMKRHKRYVHGVEKYECEFCSKKFKLPRSLKEHRTTHTGEVLYSCDYCGVTKNSRANLYSHVKHKHPTEWLERKSKKAEANAL